MKILQINVIYGHGSTGKIVRALHEEYKRQGHDSHVLFGRGPKSDDKNVVRTGFLFEAKLWRFIQLFTGHFLGGSPLSTWNLKRRIKKFNPDVVHIHCINGNMCSVFSLLKWLRKHNYKVVLTHHAKFMFTGGCGLNMCEGFASGCKDCPRKREVFGKYYLGKPSKNLKRLEALQMDGPWIKHTYVSPWLKEQAEKSSILRKADNHVVLNPIDTEIFNPSAVGGSPHDKPYAFFPTSLHAEVKGWQWIEPVGAMLKEMGLDLLVTGSGKETFASPNVRDVGYVSSQSLLADYYRYAHITLVLSQCESFSMPVAESLCCGAPVCGFKAGGPESIAPEDYVSVPNGDIKALGKAIEHTLGLARKGIAGKAMGTFSTAHIAEAFLKLY